MRSNWSYLAMRCATRGVRRRAPAHPPLCFGVGYRESGRPAIASIMTHTSRNGRQPTTPAPRRCPHGAGAVRCDRCGVLSDPSAGKCETHAVSHTVRTRRGHRPVGRRHGRHRNRRVRRRRHRGRMRGRHGRSRGRDRAGRARPRRDRTRHTRPRRGGRRARRRPTSAVGGDGLVTHEEGEALGPTRDLVASHTAGVARLEQVGTRLAERP